MPLRGRSRHRRRARARPSSSPGTAVPSVPGAGSLSAGARYGARYDAVRLNLRVPHHRWPGSGVREYPLPPQEARLGRRFRWASRRRRRVVLQRGALVQDEAMSSSSVLANWERRNRGRQAALIECAQRHPPHCRSRHGIDQPGSCRTSGRLTAALRGQRGCRHDFAETGWPRRAKYSFHAPAGGWVRLPQGRIQGSGDQGAAYRREFRGDRNMLRLPA